MSDERGDRDTTPTPTRDPKSGSELITHHSSLLTLLRPKQWAKNGLLFAGILFTLDRPHPPEDWARVAAGFVLFCLLSSAGYIANDLVDREQDRLHPRKRLRPIASGDVSPTIAAFLAGALALVGAIGSYAISPRFGLTATGYLLLTLAYSAWLKHIVIIDVLAIAAGFVARAVAGAVAVSVEISPWLLVCTTLGALFLGLAKRRAELETLQEDAGEHRPILNEYTPALLDQMITIVTSATLMAYALYTFNSPTARGHRSLMGTIPFVIYGIFRYLYLIHAKSGGGSPENTLFEDKPLLVTILLWGAACAIIVRWG
jgi:4-hydroxybenzoate polyprenyltransferase